MLLPSDAEVWAQNVLGRLGVTPTSARTVAAQLVRSDLIGHVTHGLNLLPDYAAQLKEGRVRGDARPTTIRSETSWLQVDGHHALGGVVLDWAMMNACRLAQRSGVCLVTVRDCGHAGRLGTFVERAAADGFASLVIAGSCGRANDAVAGGPAALTPHLGTNPVAIGIPTGSVPFVFDSALTERTYYEVVIAARESTRLAPGSIRDRNGVSSDDPLDFLGGGLLTMIGDHKGFGLAVATALLSGLSGEYDADDGSIGGHLVLAIDPARGPDGYEQAVASAVERLRTAPTIDGQPQRVPGQRAEMPAGRVLVSASLWEALEVVAGQVDVALPAESL